MIAASVKIAPRQSAVAQHLRHFHCPLTTDHWHCSMLPMATLHQYDAISLQLRVLLVRRDSSMTRRCQAA